MSAIRHPVDYLYQKLNWDFLKLMAEIAYYAEGKYGAAEQYTESRLEGEKSPLNHVIEHYKDYITGKPHDKFTDPRYHLAAIAYNAMMEYYYHTEYGQMPNPFGEKYVRPSSDQR